MKDFFNNYKKELKGIVVGILIGILVMLIFWPERIAELKDKEQVAITVDGTNITADSIYKGMKNKYSANEIVEQVDRIILDKKYTITDNDLKEIKKNAENYYSTFQSYYNITKEEFLKQNNFDSEDDFLKYLELDYKRNKLVNEYMETSVTDKEIEEYYKDNYFTPFKVEHILVKTKDNDNAKTDAEEILKYLKKNSWEDTKTKYKDKITTESFDVKFDSSLEENFVKAAKKLKDGKYTTSLVETSYGYHIIYRVETNDKEELSSVKDRIVASIVANKKEDDTNYYQKTLIIMRKEAGMEIKDTVLKKVYNNFVDSIMKKTTTSNKK